MSETFGMVCWCGKLFDAREADVARGWGLSCSKKCAAERRERKHQSGKKCALSGCNKEARRKFCCNNHKDAYHNKHNPRGFSVK